MFDVFYQGSKPNLFPFEQPAESLAAAAEKSRTRFFWFIHGDNDYSNFNFDYHSAPWEEQYVHVWPSQWQRDGQTYLARKDLAVNPQWHFLSATVTRRPSEENWTIPNYVDKSTVDFSWHPDPLGPRFQHHFPSQHQSACGVVYASADSAGIRFEDAFVVATKPTLEYWLVPEEVDTDNIDFTWHPNVLDAPYIYHFGTEYQQSVGLIYTVPSATEIKFAGPAPVKQSDKSALEVLDIFFIDKSNAASQTRYNRLYERYPHAQKVRYANSMIETITRCLARSKTAKFWVISSECVYDNFDFAWHAQPWQSYMTHVFGSQWQKWSDTFLINKYEFERCSKWCKSIEEFPNLNFVNDQPVVIPDDLYDIYWVDHGNAAGDYFDSLQSRYPKIKRTRFAGEYLDVLKRIVATAPTEYVWVISSLCDYTKFDFSWQPEPWQREMIHVFASGLQKRGDTFYIHVESFKQQMVELELLDWFNVINYCEDQRVDRLNFDTVEYANDDLVTAVKNHTFINPYTFFKPDYNNKVHYICDPCLWNEKDKKIYPISNGNSMVLVPREVKNYLKTQLYDYPYLHKDNIKITDDELDIVYISNGEPEAERWYQHLYNTVKGSGAVNFIHRVTNINGRAAAYKAAAQASSTNWFFAVFAKLEVNPNFDWYWQPDRLQGLKHYIFHSKNPVNGLEYGHMGMIAYNKKLVLETEEHGLDFTLSKPHAVVPVNSGIAHYNTSPELTWRTAFREVVKLNYDVLNTGSIESRYRLDTWLTKAQGNHAGWSIQGAKDALDYCKEVNYNYAELLLTFEWAWLQNHWITKGYHG